ITTFEELVITNSDDYEAESGTVVFYLRQKDLLKELQDAVEGLEVGQMTTIVKSSAGYHVLKLVEPDIEYFKKNEYVYYLLEDMLNDETKNVEYTGSEIYNSINKAKMAEYETELKAQKNAIAQSGSSSGSKADDNSALWTVLVIVITIVVVAVLVVLIVLASKPTPAPTHKNKNKNGTRKK
ncbi:MAG: peptidylprolyl isomerase, partial [Clostridia bacterium]|nr:peptidylprolyl isomerase [Clostridia bacterium]